MGANYRTAQQGFVAIPGLWDRVRKRVRRNGARFSYCAFVEGQPNRSYMPHFHVVTLDACPYRIKDFAVHCGFGFQAVEERITDDQAAHYVAKYASKQSPSTPKGFRRVRASQDVAELPEGTWPPLLVRSKEQTIVDYLLLVEWVSKVPIDRLYDRWWVAHEDYGLTNPDPS